MVSAYLLGSANKHCIKYKNIRCLFDGVFLRYTYQENYLKEELFMFLAVFFRTFLFENSHASRSDI